MDDSIAVGAPQQEQRSSSRRAVLGGVLGVPLLAACGSEDAESGDDAGSDSSSGSDSDSGSDSGSAAADGGMTAPASDIPVGGGAIFEDDEVVITQPVEGEFKAFSAICPHQGCVVSQVTEEGIGCSCHGSQFSLEDGSVLDGPAEEGLSELAAAADGTDVTVG